MRWHLIFTLAILSVTLLGCFSKPISNSSTGSLEQPLVVEIWASSNCVHPGDNIKLRATVTNKGNGAQVIDLMDRPVLDIIIRNQGPIARWSDGKPLTPDLTRLDLKAGESKAIELEWTVRIPSPGTVFYVDANFVYSTRVPPLTPGVTISVSICPGPLGP